MYTNINIIGEQEIFTYIVEYQKETVGLIGDMGYSISDTNNHVYFFDEDTYIQNQNHWEKLTAVKETTHIPNKYDYGTLKIYFPSHSIESYGAQGLYAITVGMRLSDKYVILGSKIINRTDSLACAKVKKYANQQYYESVSMDIIDPYDLMFNDRWNEFRKYICNEFQDGYLINSEGSNLYIALHPIQTSDNGYIKHDKFTGGQNFINISQYSKSNYFSLHIFDNTKTSLKVDERPAIKFALKFNDVYNGDIKEYMKETYGVDEFDIKYSLLIGNKDNIYVELSHDLTKEINCNFTKDQINENNFHNWVGWEEGIYVVGSADIIDPEGDSILYTVSNQIPLTEDLYKYLLKTDDFVINGYVINNVNLESVNMELKQINAVNKIENTIVQTTITNNGTNMTVPVFYKSIELSESILHPAVTETICINLDNYKSKVDSFLIQIEGTKFKEIGRSTAGVFFKIIGNKLPKKISSGTLYILNQDSELVTTGKYKYIF